MKMSICILFFCIGSLFAHETHSQVKNVTIKSNRQTTQEILQEIEKQTSYLFVYNKEEVNLQQTHSLHMTDKPVTDVLNAIFGQTGIIYRTEGDNIMLMKAEVPAGMQSGKISGVVLDETGQPVIGANIVEKGTLNGTITDTEGRFALDITSEQPILTVSYIGYISQEITIGNRTHLQINILEDTQRLDDVIVVGYGTQKRANMTGAVATVSAKELEDRPITNAAQALQGKIANLNVYNSDGKPGQKASFNIRGYAGLDATFTPLVIIDGVTGYFDDLNPNDIENLTVLKDAAASAIYGAQAAYGVILITTKSGKKNEKPVITYNNNFSFNSPTVLPKTAGSLEFAKLFREASINDGGGGVIDLETMERIEQYYYNPGSIPNNVPQLTNPDRWSDWGDGRSNANEDWAKAMFKNNQMNQNHNLAVKGGSELSTYMISAGYTEDAGKLRYYDDKYTRFNASAKVTTDVTKWLTVGVNIRYAREKIDTPAYYMNPDGGINSLINWTWAVWPTIPVLDPNGHFSPAGRMAFIHQANPNMTYTDNFWGTATAMFSILPGWTAQADFTYNKWAHKNTYSKGLIYSWSVSDEPYLDSSSTETTQVWQKTNNDDFTSSNIYTTYEKEIKGHTFKVMAGTQQEYKKTWYLAADKMGLVLPGQPSISTATGRLDAADGMDHWTTLGFFGRVNYDYEGRYLFEFNIRRDGSSRYDEGNKWGTFPAFSAGWNVAREAFFEPYTTVLSELRLRGSWGELGNMRGKTYQYISTIPYNASYGYIMDTDRIGAFGTPSLIAFNTWEKNRTLDFGIDITALNNRLTASFDWYRRDILGLITKGETVPAILGAESPETNNADIRNTGWELTLGWRHFFTLDSKPFRYGVTFNLSDYQGKVLRYSNPKGLIDDWYVGKKMGEIWGFHTDYIITDPNEAEELNRTGAQKFFGSNWTVGDIKYKDLNNDNEVNQGNKTLDDHGDLAIIGNNTPRYNFGLGLNAEWNGFDFSVFFQGTAKRDMWLSGKLAWGLGGGQWDSNVWKNTLDCWREDGSNPDPYWPKFYLGNSNKNLRTQTRYLDNAAYCRMKNLQFGYTLPAAVMRHVPLQRVRFYFSGDNLLTITKINENFDPEAPSSSLYPLSKSFSFGMNVTF